jgi:hypothetical protein
MLRSLVGVNSSTEETLFELQQGKFKKLNLLGIQLRALHLSGILPPSSITISPCKSFLYNIFTAISLLSLVTHIVAEVRAIYEHRNKLEMVTALTFQMTLFIHTTTLTAYFVFHREQLVRLLASLEFQFVPHIEKVGSPTRHGPIIRKVSKYAFLLTWGLLIVWLVVLFAWGALPMMVRYFDVLTSNEQKTDETLESRDKYLKYFGLIMWLPPNIDKFPIYELVYTFNAFATYAVSCCCTAAHSVFLIFMYNISTHLKILTSCIEVIDEMFPQPMETINKFSADIETKNIQSIPNVCSLGDEILGQVLPERVTSSGRQEVQHEIGRAVMTDLRGAFTDECDEKHVKMSTLSVSDGTKNTFLPNESEELSSREEKMYRYLIECIKYHQAILQ